MAKVIDLVGPLKNLARKCVDRDCFAYAESFCNLLCAIHTGRWGQLSDDDQTLWLERMASLLHVRGLGDSWEWDDPDYAQCRELVEVLLKAKKR